MTFELLACLALMIVAMPLSRDIAAHFAMFALANVMLLGVEYADGSVLAMMFAALAIGDFLLASIKKRASLYLSAVVMVALSFESVNNGDLLLSNAIYLSALINGCICIGMYKELSAWMAGRSQRLSH